MIVELAVMGNSAGALTAEPVTGTEMIFAEVLADLVHVEQVSVDSHFFDDLGADSLVMAHFCARVRKRPDLPSVSMKDIYRHPTLRSLAAALAPAAPAAPGRGGGAGEDARVHRVRSAAAPVLSRLRLGGRADRRPSL
jgi:acyl carrier protein